jgi:hypothetical protein
MTRTQHLLIKLMEECAEVQQRASKALIFTLEEIEPGQPYRNRDRLSQEITDLIAVLEMLEEDEIISFSPVIREQISEKKKKVLKFLDYSRELGTLKE